MVAAFVFFAAYLGFAGFGSELMDPPPKPSRALSAPADGSIAVASRGGESADAARAADR